ncbi:hypothetical protein GV64_12385 [Endozoicomonas elysicola]|uniref:Integrase n=2 Tax=Endozoicomonas elysicola TaxID=305900 RepID=A0A081KBA5_9GAMM|nr:hypothetical protein GV64_12385 [Endozoicomonas elysicola]
MNTRTDNNPRINGGNILFLQRTLEHTDNSMTIRYAKFDPNHFQEGIILNLLSDMEDDTEGVLEETEELFR